MRDDLLRRKFADAQHALTMTLLIAPPIIHLVFKKQELLMQASAAVYLVFALSTLWFYIRVAVAYPPARVLTAIALAFWLLQITWSVVLRDVNKDLLVVCFGAGAIISVYLGYFFSNQYLSSITSVRLINKRYRGRMNPVNRKK